MDSAQKCAVCAEAWPECTCPACGRRVCRGCLKRVVTCAECYNSKGLRVCEICGDVYVKREDGSAWCQRCERDDVVDVNVAEALAAIQAEVAKMREPGYWLKVARLISPDKL